MIIILIAMVIMMTEVINNIKINNIKDTKYNNNNNKNVS